MEPTKNYADWHSQKSTLEKHKIRPFFNERDVWFSSVGANIGFEQDGKGDDFLRPVVIIRKFNSQMLWAVPTTKKNKSGNFYFKFFYKKSDYTTAILSQLRLIDSKRLEYRIGSMNTHDFAEMKKRLISFLK